MKNLKKSLKKITTLFMLALAVVTSLPVNALAEISSSSTGTVTGQTATVTINGVESGNDKVKVNAYRIVDVIIDDTAHQPKAPVYVWAQNVGEWMVTNHPELVKKDKSNNYVTYTEGGVTRYVVGEKFCSSGSTCITSAEAEALYAELAAGVKAATPNPNVTPTAFDSADDGKINMELGFGNYLILINNGYNVYKPYAVNVVPEYKKTSEDGVTPEVYEWVVKSDTLEINAKSTPVDIDKSIVEDGENVNETNVSIGDTVTYQIIVGIPDFPTNAISKDIIIKDEFSDGLTFKEITSVVLTKEGSDDKDIKNDLGNAYAPTAGGKGFTITFDGNTDGLNNYSLVEGWEKLVITYTATVNENAVIGPNGNENTATLEYSNDPYSTSHKTTKDEDVTVYTYGVKVYKTNAKTGGALDGAEFSISNADGVISFVALDARGNVIPLSDTTTTIAKYRKATAEEITAGNVHTTDLVAPETGLVLDGLDEGEYTLTETKAPEGFVKLESGVTFTITAQTDEETELLNGLVDDSETVEEPEEDEYYEIQIENSDDVVTLPVTGGMGTLLFSVIGILFMGLGAFLIKNILRKENVQE